MFPFLHKCWGVDHTHLFQPTLLLSLPPPLPLPLDGRVEGQVEQEHDDCLSAEVAQTVIVRGVEGLEAVHNDGELVGTWSSKKLQTSSMRSGCAKMSIGK